MGVLLFFLSLLLLVVFVIRVNKDFANPGFIYLGIWVLATLSSVLILKGVDISFKTLIVIISGNVLFSLGILSSQYFVAGKKQDIPVENTRIPIGLTICLFIVVCFGSLYIYRNLMTVSRLVEPSTAFNKVLEGARYASTHSIGRISYISATLLRFYYSLGVVYFYYYCKAIFYNQGTAVYRYITLLMSVFLLGTSILSAGRSELLGMISAYLILLLSFYSKRYAWSNIQYRGKVLKIILFAGISFLSLFILIGVFLLNRTGSHQGETLFSNLFKYLGSSIGGLDYYLNNRSLYSSPTVFGQNTFLALYSTLTSLGFYNGAREVFLPIVNISSIRTNVYTIYYYFIQDFGYFFGIFVQYFYGFLFGYFFYYIKKKRFGKYILIIYSLLSQGLIMSFFAEQLFSVFTNHIIRIFFAVVIVMTISFLNIIRWKK